MSLLSDTSVWGLNFSFLLFFAFFLSYFIMKITRLTLDNFRSHNRLDISFERDITVIGGDNGLGKTSILDAIAQLLGYLLQRLPGVPGLGTRRSDLRIQNNGKLAPAFRIWGQFDIETECKALEDQPNLPYSIDVSRSVARDLTSATRTEFASSHPPVGRLGLAPFTRLADALTGAENEGKPYLVPLIVYYGTSRAVFDTPLRRRNFKVAFARFDSLNGSLNSKANFKRVFEWFHAKEAEENREQKRQRSFDYQDPELEVVRKAIEAFFPKFKSPRTLLRPLRFVVDQQLNARQKITFDLDQLSDGYRTTLAMIVDLACRLVEANPPSNTNDPLKCEAIVLIDEVDLHLHPSWQQTILTDLRRVFPNAQFIVTTHSPQVLTTVEARSIRNLEKSLEKTLVNIPDFSLGAKSVQLLEDIFHVDARPPIPIVKTLKRYKSLVENDEWDKPDALRLREKLNNWAGNKEAELARIDIDIKMRAFRRGQK
ncbi:AAA family ATPase [Undibacterium sp. Ren11W]|uniref:AAA family ATPase n=1 Tax=Undibacterium sp. Ren11W TaxID=3413045 RepID=UPI003BF2907E